MDGEELIPKGKRKLIFVGTAVAVTFATSTAALFSGHAEFPAWAETVLDLVKWGGGMFVLGNVAEHVTERFGKS